MSQSVHEAALALWGFAVAYGLLLLLIWAPVAITRDMRRRGRHGWPYAVLYLGLPPVGLAAWLVDRGRFPVINT